MIKYYECVRAYLYNKNYKGGVSMGEGIYTLTEQGEPLYNDLVADTIFLGIDNVDAEKGLTISGRGINRDYSLRSYAYYPSFKVGENYYRGFFVGFLRKSMEGKRGRRGNDEEQVNILLATQIPQGKYSTQAFSSKNLSNVSEILLTDDEDVVEAPCGYLPETEIAWNTSCSSITKNSIYLMDALSDAQRKNVPVFLVYKPSEFEEAKNTIFSVIEALPQQIANTISFDTCFTRALYADELPAICGAPTQDEEYIRRLGERGIVIHLGEAFKSDDGESGYVTLLTKEPEERQEQFRQELFESCTSVDELDFRATQFMWSYKLDDPEQNANHIMKLTGVLKNDLATKTECVGYDLKLIIDKASVLAEQKLDEKSLYSMALISLAEQYKLMVSVKKKEAENIAKCVYRIFFGAIDRTALFVDRFNEISSWDVSIPIISHLASNWGRRCAGFDRVITKDHAEMVHLMISKLNELGIIKKGERTASEMPRFFIRKAFDVVDDQKNFVKSLVESNGIRGALDLAIPLSPVVSDNKNIGSVFVNVFIENGMIEQAAYALYKMAFYEEYEKMLYDIMDKFIYPDKNNRPKTIFELFKAVDHLEALFAANKDMDNDAKASKIRTIKEKIRKDAVSRLFPQDRSKLDENYLCESGYTANNPQSMKALRSIINLCETQIKSVNAWIEDGAPQEEYKYLENGISTIKQSFEEKSKHYENEDNAIQLRINFVMGEAALINNNGLREIIDEIGKIIGNEKELHHMKIDNDEYKQQDNSYKQQHDGESIFETSEYRNFALEKIRQFLTDEKVRPIIKAELCKLIKEKRRRITPLESLSAFGMETLKIVLMAILSALITGALGTGIDILLLYGFNLGAYWAIAIISLLVSVVFSIRSEIVYSKLRTKAFFQTLVVSILLIGIFILFNRVLMPNLFNG